MLSLQGADFPAPDGLIRATWAPILLRPILGSPEQFVIGIVAFNKNGFYVARANSLDRLYCVFADDAASAILAAEAGLDALHADLATRSAEAVRDFKPIFSGVALGELGEAQGETLEKIASSWMAALSSVYTAEAEDTIALSMPEGASVSEPLPERQRDRLPTLIFEYVGSRRPGLSQFFSTEIREVASRRRANASAVFIDYAGSKVVANFGTLSVNNHATAVDRIKRRLWDLKVDRDNEKAGLHRRDHEMLVQHPSETDPQFSSKQFERIAAALQTLTLQADQEEIRFRPMNSVEAIGEHLLQKEAA